MTAGAGAPRGRSPGVAGDGSRVMPRNRHGVSPQSLVGNARLPNDVVITQRSVKFQTCSECSGYCYHMVWVLRSIFLAGKLPQISKSLKMKGSSPLTLDGCPWKGHPASRAPGAVGRLPALGWEGGTRLCQPGGLRPATVPLFNGTTICIVLPQDSEVPVL